VTEARIEALGDSALLITLGERIDAQLNARAVALAERLAAARLPGVGDVAPAYASVCLRYDPVAWSGAGNASPFAAISARLRELLQDELAGAPSVADSTSIDIAVCYGGEFGPDLQHVAAHAKLDVDEVVARHCAGEYRVAMLGFAPGFPYLLGLDVALHAPRRDSPRVRVPAGSVAIGGAQTGIYPSELPGGWQIIGRTPLTLFDATRAMPALLAAGQHVRFRAISPAQFAARAA